MRRASCAVAMLAVAHGALTQGAFAQEPPDSRAMGQSQREHVPPDPPQSQVHAMAYGEMTEMMGMDDRRLFGKVMLDRLEWRDAARSAYEWEAGAWYGGDFSKLWFEIEGEHANDSTDARVELLWDRIATAWWSTRLGIREDTGAGPERGWLAFGVAGLAPGFIEVEAMGYIGDGGRTALRLSTRHDLLLTQRLVLRPQLEFNVYGRDDAGRGIDAGLSDMELGLRLRYEFRREVAPYFGVSWSRTIGDNADEDLAWVAGIRLWF